MRSRRLSWAGLMLAIGLLGGTGPTEAQEAPVITDQVYHRGVDSAFALFAAGDHTEAERRFRLLIRHRPQERRALFGLATIMAEMHRYEEAIDIFEQLVETSDRDHGSLNNLAWIYAAAEDHRLRDGQRAIDLAQESLLLEPRQYYTWHTLANAYHIMGRYLDALRALEEAIRYARRAEVDATLLRRYERLRERIQLAHKIERGFERAPDRRQLGLIVAMPDEDL